jgi:hypothetical protein
MASPTAGFNVRLGVKDAAVVQRALEQLGNEGSKSLEKLNRAAKRADSQGFQAFNRGAQSASQTATRFATNLGPIGAGLSALGPAGIAAGAGLGAVVIGVKTLGSEVLRVAREFEVLRVQLRTVTGSAEFANLEFDRIKAFAKSTPFEVQNLVVAFNRLSAAGIRPTTERLTAFGDTAAAFGKDITEFADAVVGAITGEGERLKQFGVITRFEQDKVRFTFQGTTKVVQRDAESIVAALEEIGRTAFAGGMIEQSKTLEGAASNLADAWSSLLDQFNKTTGISGQAASGIRSITSALESLEEVLRPDNISEELGKINAELAKLDKVIEFSGKFGSIASRQRGAAAEARREVLLSQRQSALNQLDVLRKSQDAVLAQQTLAEEEKKRSAEQSERERRRARARKAAFAEIERQAALQDKARLEASKRAQAILEERRQKAIAARKQEDERQERLRDARFAVEERQAAAQDRARMDASRRAQAIIKEQRAQAKVFNEYLKDLEREPELLKLGTREREVQVELIRAQEQAGRALTETEENRVRLAVERRQAEEDAAATAEELARKEAQRAEERARLMQQPFLNAIDGIQSAFSDFFQRVFSGGVRSFSNFAETVKQIFIRLAAEIAALLVFRPAIGSILGSVGLGAVANSLGANAAGSVGSSLFTSTASNFLPSASLGASLFGAAGGSSAAIAAAHSAGVAAVPGGVAALGTSGLVGSGGFGATLAAAAPVLLPLAAAGLFLGSRKKKRRIPGTTQDIQFQNGRFFLGDRHEFYGGDSRAIKQAELTVDLFNDLLGQGVVSVGEPFTSRTGRRRRFSGIVSARSGDIAGSRNPAEAFANSVKKGALIISDRFKEAFDRGGIEGILAQIQAEEQARVRAVQGIQNFTVALESTKSNLRSFFENLITPLAAFQSQLQFGSLSALSPGERLAEARGSFASTIRAARRGNISAIEALPGIGAEVIGLARENFASGPGFVSTQQAVSQGVSGVLSQLERRRDSVFSDFSIPIVQTVQSQTATLTSELRAIRNGIRSLEDEIRRLEAFAA